jgi:hypothetical protein
VLQRPAFEQACDAALETSKDDPAVALAEGQQDLTRIDSGFGKDAHGLSGGAVLVVDDFGRWTDIRRIQSKRYRPTGLTSRLPVRMMGISAEWGVAKPEPEFFARVLAEITYQLPVIVVVDDLPHADPASRRLIGYLRAHAPAGLFLLLIGRDDEPGEPEPAAGRFVRLLLAGLHGSEIEAMLASMLSLVDEPLREVAGRIEEESGGNPRRAGVLLREMVDNGSLVRDPWGQWRGRAVSHCSAKDPE